MGCKVDHGTPYRRGIRGFWKNQEGRSWNNVLKNREPHFLKVCHSPIHCYEGPTTVPVFDNWKKSKEDSHYYERRERRTAYSVCFSRSCYGGGTHPTKWEWRRQAASPGTTLSVQLPVCEYLCFILIYSVHPLARCVLRISEKPER